MKTSPLMLCNNCGCICIDRRPVPMAPIFEVLPGMVESIDMEFGTQGCPNCEMYEYLSPIAIMSAEHVATNWNAYLKDREDESSLPPGSLLLLDENRGVHIPRDFADNWWGSIVNEEDFEDFATLRRIIRGATGLSEEQAGPDYANECWQEVVDKARLKINDKLYTLREEGDLWVVPMAVDAAPEPGVHDMYGDEIADLRQMALEDKLSILRDNAGNPVAYIIKGQEAAVRNMISDQI